MKKLTSFFIAALCIHSVSYAFCPFEDHFKIKDSTDSTTFKFLPFSPSSKEPTVNIGMNPKIIGSIKGTMAIIQETNCSSLSDWGNGLAQMRIGKDDKNYCDIDIWDGAGMSEATVSRKNCQGTLIKDIEVIHTSSITSDYEINVYTDNGTF